MVEPDEAQREITAMMIQSHGYRVMEARAAEEALALAERFEPGLVLVNAKVAEER
ncbi:MAG: response regulator, partial [Anaerolineae bacterium]|nr:response regulator [Anaerolineae bacterium]